MAPAGSLSNPFSDDLRNLVHALPIRLGPEQFRDFERFGHLLLAQNQILNLTAITDPAEVVRRHFLDSLTLALAVDQNAMQSSLQVCDIGSGGGLPGIPLAIAFPTWTVTLVESVRKKADAMGRIVSELGLTNVQVRAERSEVTASQLRDAFDLCVARAVAETRVLVEYCAPLVRTQGQIVLYKSGDVQEEINRALPAMAALECRLNRVVTIPETLGLASARALVVIDKIAETPSKYPRRVGVARLRPL